MGESDLQQTFQMLTEPAAPVQGPEQHFYPILPSLSVGRGIYPFTVAPATKVWCTDSCSVSEK